MSKHIENSGEFESLKVNDGIAMPDGIHQDAVRRFKKKRKPLLAVEEYFEGIRSGNRTILSKAITLVESSLSDHRAIAKQLIEKCLPHSGNSLRLGITGVPGVGKSTFIEGFGNHIIRQNRSIAVLAIDPSSQRSGGSILGDKTRMETLVNNPRAFVRPSPSAGSLGGVAQKTRETIILCEAAGFDTILIETVGVGQSEVAVHSMVDFFLLLMLGGAGDELQGIKRGIMEMADGIAVTKADGDNLLRADRARVELQNALHLFPLAESGWTPPVSLCSALKNTGIAELWDTILDYHKFTLDNGYFLRKREQQIRFWLHEAIQQRLKESFYGKESVQLALKKFEEASSEHMLNPFDAADELFKLYREE